MGKNKPVEYPGKHFYTVKEIIDNLGRANPEAIVLIQRDPEGNGIHDIFEFVTTDRDELVGGKPSVTIVAGSAYLE